MKDRIRIGLRIKLPFGLFPNAGVFVVYADFSKVQEKVNELKQVLYSTGNTAAEEFADRLFCEKA